MKCIGCALGLFATTTLLALEMFYPRPPEIRPYLAGAFGVLALALAAAFVSEAVSRVRFRAARAALAKTKREADAPTDP